MADKSGSMKSGAGKAGALNQPVTIKKYANRRLYNTATSSYVTLDNLCVMVKEGIDFTVSDAKTGEDITRAVLTQIIVEEEGKGQNLLPISFLRQLIAFYGDSMQWLVPSYLENTMMSFSRNQEQMRRYMADSFGTMFPFGGIEQVSKQNIAIIERAMKMFTPFSGGPGGLPGGPPGGPWANVQFNPSGEPMSEEHSSHGAVDYTVDPSHGIGQLRDQMAALQRQLEALMDQRVPPKPPQRDE
jgi:polyhydroxyalkanoate synthesis repressor PhaR